MGKKKKSSRMSAPSTPSAAPSPRVRPRSSDANPRPRGKNKFSFRKHGRPQSRAPKGDMTMKEDAPQHELVRPSWNGSTGTTVRILPCYDVDIEDDLVFAHSRRNPIEWDFNDWIRGYDAVSYVGVDKKLTFLLLDPTLPAEELNENPYMILYWAIKDATGQGSAKIGDREVITNAWFPLTNRDSPKYALKPATRLYFIQGLIYQHNGQCTMQGGYPRGAKDKDVAQVLELSKTAGESLLDALNARKEEGEYDGEDYDQFVYPDVTSLTDGYFVTFYNPDKHNVGQSVTPTAGGAAVEEELSQESSGRSTSREFKGWKVDLRDEFNYMKEGSPYVARRNLTVYEDKLRQNLIWFDNLLRVPTKEETCALLAQAFRSMPDLLYFAWQDHQEFFTDEVREILATRTSGDDSEVPELRGSEVGEEPLEEPMGPVESAALPQVETPDVAALAASAQRAQERARARRDEGASSEAVQTPPKKKKKKKASSAGNGSAKSATSTRQKVPVKKKKKSSG